MRIAVQEILAFVGAMVWVGLTTAPAFASNDFYACVEKNRWELVSDPSPSKRAGAKCRRVDRQGEGEPARQWWECQVVLHTNNPPHTMKCKLLFKGNPQAKKSPETEQGETGDSGGQAAKSGSRGSSGKSVGSARSVTKPKRRRSKNKMPLIDMIRAASKKYGLPEALLVGVMYVESRFKPRALSRVGAMGLMQLMPNTAAGMGVTDPYDPYQSIMGGARYLRTLADRFGGDYVKVLSAYHAGGAAVARKGGIPYEQTATYVKNVLNAYYGYKDGKIQVP